MSRQWTVEVTPEARALVRRMQDRRRIAVVVARALDLQNELTVGSIQEERLTGKGPFPPAQHRLGVRTNRLRSSVRPSKAVVTDTGAESSIGTNVKYARAHEYGVDETVMVRPHTRRGQRLMTLRGGQGQRVVKRAQGPDVAVGSHKRRMRLPARAPITTGVRERLGRYGEVISAAIVRALGGSSNG